MPLVKCHAEELNLGVVLLSGQSFRWKKTLAGDENVPPKEHDVYIGVAKHRAWKLWREDVEHIGYEVLTRFSKATGSDLDALSDYFQLAVKVEPLYAEWMERDKHFAAIMASKGKEFQGIRILGQDPIETVFSFICSANNHIRRITNMVDTLCKLYGEPSHCRITNGDLTFYDFADPKRMAEDCNLENILRKNGFGYRAPNIALAAQKLKDEGEEYLEALSKSGYENASNELEKIRGVGRKVADCICLMGLRMHDVVPADTHILQISVDHYMASNMKNAAPKAKALQAIGRVWQEKFGDYAGWAQAVLFAAHLKPQKDLLKKKTKKK